MLFIMVSNDSDCVFCSTAAEKPPSFSEDEETEDTSSFEG